MTYTKNNKNFTYRTILNLKLCLRFKYLLFPYFNFVCFVFSHILISFLSILKSMCIAFYLLLLTLLFCAHQRQSNYFNCEKPRKPKRRYFMYQKSLETIGIYFYLLVFTSFNMNINKNLYEKNKEYKNIRFLTIAQFVL